MSTDSRVRIAMTSTGSGSSAAHNQYAAEQIYGRTFMQQARALP